MQVWIRYGFMFISFYFFISFLELDLNRLDGDTVCPPLRNGQDDLPGKIQHFSSSSPSPPPFFLFLLLFFFFCYFLLSGISKITVAFSANPVLLLDLLKLLQALSQIPFSFSIRIQNLLPFGFPHSLFLELLRLDLQLSLLYF